MKKLDLYMHTCDMCGKSFECTKDYVYKVKKWRKQEAGKGKTYFFCSYSCFKKAKDSNFEGEYNEVH